MAKDVPKKTVNKAAKSKRKISMKKFFRETVSEMKKVTWPTRKELTNYTVVVVVVIVIFAIIIGAIDMGLTQLLNLIS
jgi:preprotein translocase subunit SecE